MNKACMVVHSYYPDDPRVRREAEALIGAGWTVDIICLRGKDEAALEPHSPNGGAPAGEIIRLPISRHRGSGLATYMAEYFAFGGMAAARLARLHAQRHYDVVQVHNMPDFLVFSAIGPRLAGARVILDIHDLVPELYAARFGGRQDHPFVQLTRLGERFSTRFADHVITAGEPFRRRLVARGLHPDKVTVVMNSADPALFHPITIPARPDGFALVYHGGVFERYGLDIAIRAVARIRPHIPHLTFDIYGAGEALPGLRQLADSLGLADAVRLHGFIPIDQIPQRIAGADLGVVPYRNNPFTSLLYPTKAFEYIAMGIPVVMSRSPALMDLFGEVPDLFVPPEDETRLGDLLLALYRQPERRQQLLQAARRAYKPYAWEAQRQGYLDLIRRLTSSGPLPQTVTQ